MVMPQSKEAFYTRVLYEAVKSPIHFSARDRSLRYDRNVARLHQLPIGGRRVEGHHGKGVRLP